MIEDWIKRYFAGDQVEEVLAILSEYGTEEWHREAGRVKRDAVIISRGSIDRLKSTIRLAKTDYRDVLIGEEVDPWVMEQIKRYEGKAGSRNREAADSD